MDNNIAELYSKFYKIRNMGYVKTVKNGYCGIGLTFEKLLGKEQESFELPDYKGIEIKTKRGYSTSDIRLFNAVPTGSSFYEVKRLRDCYGWNRKDNNNIKCLYFKANAIRKEFGGYRYLFKLDVNVVDERIYLEVYNRNFDLIDKSTYWDFEVLKEKMERKLKYLAVVKAWRTSVDHIDYYKYYKMNVYRYNGFQYFIDSLINGKISIDVAISSFDGIKKYGLCGNVDSHGVGFMINEQDLLSIFSIY